MRVVTVRDPVVPAEASTTPDGPRPDPLRSPHLGWRPFGYSRRKTDALLSLAASLIEELTDQVVQQQGAHAETEARLVEVTAEIKETSAKLEASRAELERVRAESAKRAPDEAERATIGMALISAHRAAAEIVARARRGAEEILATARSDATSIEEEANHVIEQAEIRAHGLVEHAGQEAESLRAESDQLSARIKRERQLWTAFLRRALDATGQAGPAPELDPTAGQQRDLEGELHGVIRATERP